MIRKNIAGQRFGKLTVIRYVETVRTVARWEVKCDCGVTKTVQGQALASGNTTSCGCNRTVKTIARNRTHGKYFTPEHVSWNAMKNRCTNPKSLAYKNYGGRGIKVCDRWLNSFENFLADMGQKPSLNYSIERISVDGDYSPENCKWVTKLDQARNTRANVRLTYKGETKSIAEWAEQFNMNYATLFQRVRVAGMPIGKALTTPVKKTGKPYCKPYFIRRPKRKAVPEI